MLVTFKLFRYYYSASLIIIFLAFSNHVSANDIFVGKFTSLATPFPPFEEANIIEIFIVPKGDKYIVTEFTKGEFKHDFLAKRCDSKQDHNPMSLFAPGEVYILCHAESGFEKFVYSQNGIDGHNPSIQNLKNKTDESLFEKSYFQSQYYVFPFAFRKVDSFKYAPNDSIKLLSHETPEFKTLCKDVGVKLFEKPLTPVRSIAYDFNPKRISGWLGAERVELDEDGRTLGFGGFSKRNSAEARKVVGFEFTERRRGDGAGAATINPSAPYYHFPARGTNQPYFGVNKLSADVLAFLDVDKPEEYRKAPILQGAIRYQITLTDRRSDAVLGVQVFVVDRLNNRACGVNVDNVISPDAFIFDAINR
ncbi:MAG: hypothetical protein LLG40_02685 [Deltaproteobacteria bacterium]|nr:hypothetical protein [Deltaproteobacteria bacterium]